MMTMQTQHAHQDEAIRDPDKTGRQSLARDKAPMKKHTLCNTEDQGPSGHTTWTATQYAMWLCGSCCAQCRKCGNIQDCGGVEKHRVWWKKGCGWSAP